MLIPLALGDIKSEDADKIADLADLFGKNTLRFSIDQNIYLRNIPESFLGNVYTIIKQLDTLSFQAPLTGKIIACAGAGTCKLGICLSRGALTAIYKKLNNQQITLDDIKGLSIHISGCPNACGQHFAAQLGFFGRVLHKEGRAYPAYTVLLGADLTPGKTKLAEKAGTIPSRDLPEFIVRVINDYLEQSKDTSDFHLYLEQGGSERIKSLCNEFKDIPAFTEDRNYYYDWDAEDVFSTIELGQGECSAGLFDMINVEINQIKKDKETYKKTAITEEKTTALYGIVRSASSMLLVTKGLEVKDEKDIFRHFKTAFINPGLIPTTFEAVVTSAENNNIEELEKNSSIVFDLATNVIELYEKMDDSLRFPGELDNTSSTKEKTVKLLDLRGVACPMNFVKTKVELSSMEKDSLVEVYLDDGEPINNVPGSVKGEGHTILKKEKIDNYWSITIKKGE